MHESKKLLIVEWNTREMFQRVRGTLGRVHEVQAFFGFFCNKF